MTNIAELRLLQGVPLHQQLNGLSYETRSKRVAEFDFAATQQINTITNDWPSDEIALPSRRCRAGSRREWKNMHVNKTGAINDIERLLEIGVRLARETDDNVGRQGCFIECQINAIQESKEIIARILAIHFPKNIAGAALKRQMEMRNNLRMRSKHLEQFVIKVAGLEAGKTQAAKSGNICAEHFDGFSQGIAGGF